MEKLGERERGIVGEEIPLIRNKVLSEKRRGEKEL